MDKFAAKSMIRLLTVLVITVSFFATAWAQNATYFTPGSYQGTSLTYRMIANGSVEIHENNQAQSATSFSLHTMFSLDVARQTDDGLIPFTGQIRLVDSTGLALEGQSVVEPISGHLTTRGVIESVSTPTLLADRSLFLDDLLLGLIVPAPETQSAVNPIEWRAMFRRNHNRPQDITLTATYTSQGASDWGFRTLQSVTGRFRADATIRSGANRTLVQEIGHGIYYIQPDGTVEMSSVSLIVTTETIEGGGKNTRVKTSVTTTLELVELNRPATSEQPLTASPDGSPQQPEPMREHPEPSPVDPEPTPGDPEPTTEQPDASPAQGGPVPTAPDGSDDQMDTPPVPADRSPVDADQPSDVFVYHDPAQRFELILDGRWQVGPDHLTLRGTHLISPSTGEEAYIYVMPLSSPAATAASIARSALATYGETLPGFFILSEPRPELVGGDLAYVANYQYIDDHGAPVQEWALFTRKRDRAYYLEYAPGPYTTVSGLEGLMELRDGFTFGPEPSGLVSAGTLQESLRPYTNLGHRFQMLVPSLWPLTESVDGGSSTTFTEIGEHGYLTIFVDGGAQGITTTQILTAWRDEWSKEPDFRLNRDVSTAPLGTIPGATFTYTWRGPADQFWTRRVHGAIDDGKFYVVVIDYVADGYLDREPAFDAMLASFAILPPAETSSADADELADLTPDLTPDVTPDAAPDSTPGVTDPAPDTPPPFDEPTTDTSVILLGRILTRYPGADGNMIDEWGANLEVTVLANQQEYRGVTDDRGYVYVANLPQIAADRSYTILRIDGAMLGFSDRVTVSFDNLVAPLNTPRVSHLRTVIITLERDRTLTVDIVRHSATASEELSAPAYFINRFGQSAWAVHVDELVHLGLE